jgi:hypothetical protein
VDFHKAKLDDVALLGELLPLVGEELWVHALYEGLAIGSAFAATLERVEPVNWSLQELLLFFDSAGASDNLVCRSMTAWRVMNPRRRPTGWSSGSVIAGSSRSTASRRWVGTSVRFPEPPVA